jgi:hypothetical protein
MASMGVCEVIRVICGIVASKGVEHRSHSPRQHRSVETPRPVPPHHLNLLRAHACPPKSVIRVCDRVHLELGAGTPRARVSPV